MKTKVQLITGIVSLIALLAYTLVHTGGLLAVYVTPGFVGYVAAFGIEASIVSLSLRIGELRKSNQSTIFFLFVLIATVIVSAVANVSEGFHTSQGVSLTLETVRQLDIVQAMIGVTATGLISLIVLALSEIVGSDVTQTVKLVEKERKAKKKELPQELSHTEESNSIETAREFKALQDEVARTDRHGIIVDTLRQKPMESKEIVKKIVTLTGVSRQTVYRDINTLVETGALHKNGGGYEVTG